MLDINLIRKDPDRVRQALINRGTDPGPVDEILALDAQRRAIIVRAEQLRALRNTVSKQIGQMRDEAEREAKKAEMRRVGDEIAALEDELGQVEAKLDELTAGLPNLPDPRVPIGPDETHNVIVRVHEGSLPKPDFPQAPLGDRGSAGHH